MQCIYIYMWFCCWFCNYTRIFYMSSRSLQIFFLVCWDHQNDFSVRKVICKKRVISMRARNVCNRTCPMTEFIISIRIYTGVWLQWKSDRHLVLERGRAPREAVWAEKSTWSYSTPCLPPQKHWRIMRVVHLVTTIVACAGAARTKGGPSCWMIWTHSLRRTRCTSPICQIRLGANLFWI